MNQILIVDDNPNNLYLARFLLEQLGYKVDEATDGQQAVDAAAENSYKLILMDIQMPIMDGLTATRIIKQQQPETKIVAVTARVMINDRQNIIEAGCDGYIEKPLNIDSFTTEVKSFM